MKNSTSKDIRIYLGTMAIASVSIIPQALAQQGSQGNTTIFGGAQMTFFGNHNFLAGGSGTQPGIIGTVRTAPFGVLNFAATATGHTGANDANHVDGYVRKLGTASFIFPVGDNGLYGPFAADGDGTTGAYFHADPGTAITSSLGGGNYPALPAGAPFPTTSMSGVTAVSNIEYWDVDGANSSSLTLTWDAGSAIGTLTGSALNRLTIAGWDGSNWVPVPSTVDITSILGSASDLTAGSITTSTNIIPNTYTAYTFGSLPTPLPLSLLSFKAEKTGTEVLLSWLTAEEKNTQQFDIEHGIHGNDWRYIGNVKAKGTAAGNTGYTFIHPDPVQGINYYRLNIQDRDGASSYSNICQVWFDATGSVTLFPNPATETLQLQVSGKEEISRIAIYNAAGALVYESRNRPPLTISIKQLAAGAYTLHFQETGGSSGIISFLKK